MMSSEEYDYLLILDFEAQCSNKQKMEVQEIIEFPVVMIDVKANAVMKNYFHEYIKPVKYPTLFDFCTELTGITQDQVDNGVTLEEALEMLDKFLSDNGILSKSFVFVTCGDWDLRQCLRMEAKYKKLSYKNYLKRWINIKKVFAKATGIKKVGMKGMLEILNLPLNGRHHSGIDDAKNIAEIALELIKRGEQFNKTYESSK